MLQAGCYELAWESAPITVITQTSVLINVYNGSTNDKFLIELLVSGGCSPRYAVARVRKRRRVQKGG